MTRLLAARRAAVDEVRGRLDLIEAEQRARAQRSDVPTRIDLTTALTLAAHGSQDYLEARERVWLAALAVTGERHRWRTQYDLGGSAEVARTDDGTSIAAAADGSVIQSLEAGGSLLLSIATDILRDLTGSPLRTARTLLASELVLSLARGSGRLVALEPLRQAQFDLLYELREFARFQQAFTIDIATRFYRTLQLRDIWRNETRTYESLQALVEVQADKASSGRLPDFQVDQARQELLQADDRRARALASYEASIEQLLLAMGLPVSDGVELDDTALEALRAEGPLPAPFSLEHALATAAVRRLDLATARDRERDACRHVAVARDALRMGLDLRVGAGLTTENEQPFDLADAAFDSLLGLDVDLPLERTDERNELVRRLVTARRLRRDQERLGDAVDVEVRQAWRDLAEAARSIMLQRESLRLAERRVESTELLLEQGAATIRDRLDAENARVASANALTRALVDHVLVRLEAERATGVLVVDENAGWTWAPPLEEPPAGAAPALPQAGPAVEEGAWGEPEAGVHQVAARPESPGPAGLTAAAATSNPGARDIVLPDDAASSAALGAPPTSGKEPSR